MPQIQIISDGTRAGTQVTVDGKDITNTSKKKEIKITSVEFMASAGGEYVDFGYTQTQPYYDENGNKAGRERVHYNFSNSKWMNEEPERYEIAGLGEAEKTQDGEEKGIGGKIMQDLDSVSKAERLLLDGK